LTEEALLDLDYSPFLWEERNKFLFHLSLFIDLFYTLTLTEQDFKEFSGRDSKMVARGRKQKAWLLK
jgi:sugar/nucleoside kinase (ribokinase family)